MKPWQYLLPLLAVVLLSVLLGDAFGLYENSYPSASHQGASPTMYVALDITAPQGNHRCGREVSARDYTRVPVIWANFHNRRFSNARTLTFPAPLTRWGEITGACVYDALTDGTELAYIELTVPKAVWAGDAPPEFAPGSLTIERRVLNPAPSETEDEVRI